MKKKWIAALGLTIALLMAACGNEASQTKEEGAVQTAAEDVSGSEEAKETVAAQAEAQSADTEGTEAMEEPAEGIYEGIVQDAAMNSFSIVTKEGKVIYFTLPEAGGSMELKDGMLIGIPVSVEVKSGEAVSVTDSELPTKASRQALEFAMDVWLAMSNADMDMLVSLTGFPVAVDGEEVADAEALKALGEEKIFSRERIEAVLSTDLYELEELSDGRYVMSGREDKPNVIFSKDEANDRGFSVTGMN